MSSHDAHEQYWWRIALELELRRVSGNEFQNFFARVMEKAHGDDFVRVRPYGRRGDKGCDGYLTSTGEVFQCYGALNADQGKVDYLISKLQTDFSQAKAKVSHVMRRWTMVHNLVDGLPVEAIEELDRLKKTNLEIQFSFFGYQSFEEKILNMGKANVVTLLGTVAGEHNVRNLPLTELRELIASIAEDLKELPPLADVRPVPQDKLELNRIPTSWRTLLMVGYQNTSIIADYLENHPDVLLGERVASWFHVKYLELGSQCLSPGRILSGLYELIVGIGYVSPERQVTAQALLAYLFERCDIFEDALQPERMP